MTSEATSLPYCSASWLGCSQQAGTGRRAEYRCLLCVVVHDDGHAVHVEAVGLRHHALAEAVRDVVRAQQARDHDGELDGHDGEDGGEPALEDGALKLEVRALASGKNATRIARLADGGLDEGVEVATAAELILNAQPAVNTEGAGPLGVELALEVERVLLVGDVPGRDEERERDPEEEGEPREEGPVVEQNAGPADERGEDGNRGGSGGDDELDAVADANDVGVRPHVEPDEQAGDEAGQRVRRELKRRR